VAVPPRPVLSGRTSSSSSVGSGGVSSPAQSGSSSRRRPAPQQHPPPPPPAPPKGVPAGVVAAEHEQPAGAVTSSSSSSRPSSWASPSRSPKPRPSPAPETVSSLSPLGRGQGQGQSQGQGQGQQRVFRERGVGDLERLLAMAARVGEETYVVGGAEQRAAGQGLLLRRVPSERVLGSSLAGLERLQRCLSCWQQNLLGDLDSFAANRAKGLFFLIFPAQHLVQSARSWIDRHQSRLRDGPLMQRWEEDLSRRLRVAVLAARGLKALHDAGWMHCKFDADAVVMDDELCTVKVVADVLGPVDGLAVAMNGALRHHHHHHPAGQGQGQGKGRGDGRGKAVEGGGANSHGHGHGQGDGGGEGVSPVHDFGLFLHHLFTGNRVDAEDRPSSSSMPSPPLPGASAAPAAGVCQQGVAGVGGYLEEIPDLKALVQACLAESFGSGLEGQGQGQAGAAALAGGGGMEALLVATTKVMQMRCAKVALERVEKGRSPEESAWVVRPRKLDLYISPGAVGEIIAKLQTLPNSRPYSMWTAKLQSSLGEALEAYQGWVSAMVASPGALDERMTEAMFSTLSVTLPRAFCEVTSKAFMTALELPFLFTSFETFRHVRDQLLKYHRQAPPHRMADNQKRIDCLNTLLYLRGLSAGEYTYHDKLDAGSALFQLPTTLAEEVLGVFTDIYRTIHALGFEDVTNFESIVAVVRAMGMSPDRDGPRTSFFLEGLGTGP
jgi:hypothetical protein